LVSGEKHAAGTYFDVLAAKIGERDLVSRVIVPALIEAGERWYRGECGIFEEHRITAFLRCKLEVLIEQASRANQKPAQSVVVGTARGERHEGGGLLATLMLERAGWEVVYLGAELPVAELGRAVERFQPDALALSFVMSRNIHKRFRELSAIVDVPIFVGGRSILNHQGLARRHGLIPLVGSLESCVEQMQVEIQAWKTKRSRRREAGQAESGIPS
jgi:methanogenic corrinoid protein MtbC1